MTPLFKVGGLGSLLAAFFWITFGICTVNASIPSSKRVDLSTPSHDLYRHKTFRDDTVQQGFTFDNVNRRLFVAQRRNGASEAAGDLTITQLDFEGNYVGHMYLKDFGLEL